jgi:hypothetical protein
MASSRALSTSGFPFCSLAQQPDVREIVRRSVAANEADWQAAPNYAFTERDVETKRGGNKVVKSYQVIMVNGSPYNRLVAVNDKPLSAEQNSQEENKMRQEAVRRRSESASSRAKRVAKYQRERHQDHQMMTEMATAFNYRLAGEATVDGHPVYILDATPNPSYTPHSRETRVLIGMRGRMWIDKSSYQWVKVEAEVTKPVEFGMFIAKVSPGTRFELEQRPVDDGRVWMPVHFSMKVNASVLGMFSENSTDDETYTHYLPNRTAVASLLK